MAGLRNPIAVLAQYRQDIVVIVTGLTIFLFLMALVAWLMFPEGQRLADIGPGDRGDGPAQTRSEHRISYATDNIARNSTVARLTRVVRNVDHRGGSEVVWMPASDEMMLAHRDAVQTQSRSRAFISFAEGGHLRLDENSLVVIRQSAPDPFAARTRPAVVMVRGSLSGGFHGGGAAGLDVQTPVGLVSLSHAEGAPGDLSFSLGVDDENATRLSVLKGEGEIVVNGQRTMVGAEEALTIDADGRVVRHRIPSTPRPLKPLADARITFGGRAPTIDFGWQGGAETYRLLLARDAGFDNILIDARTGRLDHELAALRPGKYWWRVSGVVDGHEGPASTPRMVELVRDQKPPTLSLEPLPARVTDSAVTVRGNAAPGADVFVRGQPVDAGPDGTFEHVLSLSPGTNVVVVEAVDGLGNVAFASATITSKRTTTPE